ncbi:hypothetical protein, partial [Anaerotruncus massiliensis (ex Liu et al. 2021)]
MEIPVPPPAFPQRRASKPHFPGIFSFPRAGFKLTLSGKMFIFMVAAPERKQSSIRAAQIGGMNNMDPYP